MTVERLRWFLDSLAFESDVKWWLKGLSANDTQLTRGHQAGPYVPRDILFAMIPELDRRDEENPREVIDAAIVSHQHTSAVTAIWYNNRLRDGTRNETRITGWGGISSPLLDPELTGAAAVFAFGGDEGARWCKIWVCVTEDETDFIEERFGAIEPGTGLVFPPLERRGLAGGCGLSASEMPRDWLRSFPSPNDVLEKSLEMRPSFAALSPDNRLLKRRACEYELFQSVENATWLPRVQDGFSTLNDFLSLAQTILQRRRSRSGKSWKSTFRGSSAKRDCSKASISTRRWRRKPEGHRTSSSRRRPRTTIRPSTRTGFECWLSRRPCESDGAKYWMKQNGLRASTS